MKIQRVPLNKHFAGLIAVLIFALTLLACDLGSLTSFLPSQPTAPAITQTTPPPGQPTTASNPASPVAKPSAPLSGRDALFGKISDPSELNSYRARMLLEARPKDGSKSNAMRLTTEWVKNPLSQHISMGEGANALQVITIGDKSWIKMGANWIESPANQRQGAASTPENYLPEQDVKVQALGDDTVNGIHCKRQSYAGKVTIIVPAIQNKPETKLTFNVKGEICVANQVGLPPVIIREKAELEGDLFGSLFGAMLGDSTKPVGTVVTYAERELYDINTVITIKPPENVTKLPAGPTIPSGKPSLVAKSLPTVKPTVAGKPATVAPQATLAVGAQLFADEFSSATLNPKWKWEDRWQDAQYNLKARTGFLRITASLGNDLAPWTNFDAPLLIQPADGNWIAETALEFAPTQEYQGAGILIYQDDDNLVRLERGYGGVGGGESGIVFAVIREGEFETIIAPAQIATAAPKVELRIQREGNRFTAWWREPGKAWQTVGSAEVKMSPTVQVGIAVLCELVAPDSIADFDYFRIARPR
jgi:regulation of enolase protein 1 (concanavalin A-like superfamily)